ncbi:unnamed protein product, partial [Mesorhabditis belari]|uniref:EB domain-containing protein n=1 Tax=Mesorhabditis belari TaxID=2138241 RepID=A0AAF3FBR6_9BILA
MILRYPIFVILSYYSTTIIANEAFSPCNGKSQLGGVCDMNADCEHKGSICLRGRCRCHPHYMEALDEKGRNPRCKSLPSKIGAACVAKCREPLFCRNGECHCVQRGATRIQGSECTTTSRVGDRCSRHYDCTAPFSACLNSTCVCISGTIQQGSRCVAAANCPLGGLPGQTCVRKTSPYMVHNLPPDQDNCPPGQICVTPSDSPIGHCCPISCPLSSHSDPHYSCDPTASSTDRCPNDTHFCHMLSDGGFSFAICCRRPCHSMAPNALFANNACIPRSQLNGACFSDAQCGGAEGMHCVQGQCECLSGFHPSVDTLTHPLKNPSNGCTRDCTQESLSRDTSCMKTSTLGGQCFIQQQCPPSSGCYRGRCLCRCGFEQVGNKCVPLPPPSTTTAAPSLNVPGLPKGNDLLQFFGDLFGAGAPAG